ncbi:hypothetical protein OEW28_05195 [Defluviimonas sp. WL0002]|uniref:Peptidase M48 domain-containing protein n=1 Tax=Albidovulum marisflavi TaxID=2984159 RepID=A0ABT2ZA72_9RHOB|nr:hypothetical protein [Defluviimonas sp. WL0002]MCV2868017.1 hypothetical protein [Defluviimonas sp. WL0002]
MRPVGSRTWAVAWLSLGLFSVCPREAAAVELTCADPALSATARDAALAAKACTAGALAKRSLTACGLVQTRPIRIAVVEQAMHPGFGACLAIYDVRAGCLEITEPDRIAPMLAGKDARADLPAEEVFGALIAHELAHALVAQSAPGIRIGPAEQEFVANVFEMMSFLPRSRELLLSAHPVDPPGSLSVVHANVYVLAPRAFVNNAWRVFEAEGNGCALVQRIIAGEYRFPER